jgi:hypothetical protein
MPCSPGYGLRQARDVPLLAARPEHGPPRSSQVPDHAARRRMSAPRHLRCRHAAETAAWRWSLIEGLKLPDPDDRHALAAAIKVARPDVAARLRPPSFGIDSYRSSRTRSWLRLKREGPGQRVPHSLPLTGENFAASNHGLSSAVPLGHPNRQGGSPRIGRRLNTRQRLPQSGDDTNRLGLARRAGPLPRGAWSGP